MFRSILTCRFFYRRGLFTFGRGFRDLSEVFRPNAAYRADVIGGQLFPFVNVSAHFAFVLLDDFTIAVRLTIFRIRRRGLGRAALYDLMIKVVSHLRFVAERPGVSEFAEKDGVRRAFHRVYHVANDIAAGIRDHGQARFDRIVESGELIGIARRFKPKRADKRRRRGFRKYVYGELARFFYTFVSKIIVIDTDGERCGFVSHLHDAVRNAACRVAVVPCRDDVHTVRKFLQYFFIHAVSLFTIPVVDTGSRRIWCRAMSIALFRRRTLPRTGLSLRRRFPR